MIPSLPTNTSLMSSVCHTFTFFVLVDLSWNLTAGLGLSGCGEYQIYLQDIALANNRMQALGYWAVFFLLKHMLCKGGKIKGKHINKSVITKGEEFCSCRCKHVCGSLF
jgi:hypothetical protein